ncbi:UNVERIFIED_CONTAM: protein NLP6 [Sesamum calycinum]|uniref:Protein NLP6 n=1 Tax=Sesamum calycinum TaxID=2727403 RepID=A0AAW2RRN8_9LAMI
MHHVYDVGEGAKEEEVGPPGRAFMNRHPESSPDLRLYSTKEHPLRDLTASCGLSEYVAWPVLDLSLTQCLGVLELLILDGGNGEDYHRLLEGALMRAELRSTYISNDNETQNFVDKKPALEEIGKMLELAIDAIPQLHLAQVWMPCQQGGDTMSCMERVVFINSADMKLGASELCDFEMSIFLEACETLHIQSKTGKSCFFQSLCDVSICEYPSAHYAQQARLSSRFTVCLQSSCDDVNDLFIVEFFLQPHSREDDCPCSTLHSLIHILKKLTSFKISSEEQFTELPIGLCTKNHPASLQSNRFDGTSEMIKYVQANEHESSREFTLISRIAGYNDSLFDSDLKEYLNKVVLSVHYGNQWVFGCPQRKELLHNQSIQEKVRLLIMSIISSGFYSVTFLIQFWEVKRQADKSFLTTLDQHFALGTHCKGLCWYRKHCTDRQYFVDDGAKEEELGPLGRVFQSRSPEFTPDIRLYSTKEFPHRDYAIQCGLRTYLALPIFNLHKSECLGVLEWIDFEEAKQGEPHTLLIRNALEEANLESPHFRLCSLEQKAYLRSTHINYMSDATQNLQCKEPPKEIREMPELAVDAITQLHLAQVWIPCTQCGHIVSCMERAAFMYSGNMKFNSFNKWDFMMRCFIEACNFQRRPGKTGVVGTATTMSCFVRNLCDVSICEYPLAHYAQQARLSSCFTVCLQSTCNVNDLFIVEFFLHPHSREDAYLFSTLQLLLQVMKKKLTSFKITSEEQLTEANEHESSTEFTLISRIAGYNDFHFFFLPQRLLKQDDGANEEELGPLGRVIRQRCPESTPNFRLYSTEEFPHRDYAIQCGCEVIWLYLFSIYTRETQKINQDSALRELKKMLRKVIRTSQSSSVAQVWLPCSQCTDTHKNLVCVRRKLVESCSAFKINRFMCKSHKVETGKGITGILLSSENKPCFFPNLCHFSITEEPQAHVVQVARFNVCFAICLQSSYTGSNLYILQFFLNLPSRKYENLCSFLSFLLLMMKETLKSFRVASGKQLGEDLVVEVISFDKNDKFTSFELHQPDVLPVRFEVTQYVEKDPRYQNSTNQLVHDSSKPVPERQLDDAATTDSEEGVTVTTKKTKGERNTTSFHISYDDLQLHFGKRLQDVAKELGVSRSTLKRACRDYGIKRWPSRQNNKKNPSLFETSTSNKRVRWSEQQVLVSSSNNLPPQISPVHNQNVLQTSGIESSQNHTILTKDGVVLIKAKFGDDIVKVQLLLSSGIGKLKEEVGKRFNLMNGSFKLYYLDEDEWILLACDDDLQLCMKTSTASGKTPIQILVKSISNGALPPSFNYPTIVSPQLSFWTIIVELDAYTTTAIPRDRPTGFKS